MIAALNIMKNKRFILGILASIGTLAFLGQGLMKEIGGMGSSTETSAFAQYCTVLRPPGDIAALAINGDTLWAGGKDGLHRIDIKEKKLLDNPLSDSGINYVRALLMAKDGSMWIGHDGGLTRLDGSGHRTFTRKDGLPDNRVSALLQDRRGQIWVGTWEGVAILDGEGNLLKGITAREGMLDSMTNVILEDRNGGYWLGSYVAPRGGMSYFYENVWKHFNNINGLPHNNITSILQDRRGRIWIGTGLYDRGGAAVLAQEGGNWRIEKTLTKKDGLCGEKVRSLYEDKDGAIWMGSEYDGLTIYKEEGSPMDSGSDVSSSGVPIAGSPIAGSPRTGSSSRDGSSPDASSPSGEGENNGKMMILTAKDGLSDNEVKAILQDGNGDIWLGTRNGITHINWSAAGF